MSAPSRFIAIDWSGALDVSTQKKRIWIADADEKGIGLQSGMTREEVCTWLVQEAKNAARPMVVGLDFAFSFPASYFKQHGLATVEELWHAAKTHGEAWLRNCDPPFWGRPQKKCPSTHFTEGFRQTDLEVEAISGIRPKSPLQIGGAGAVGTGSLRGMPMLLRLREAGFSLWPFHAPGFPTAFEIYPRLFTGPVKKSNAQERSAYLRRPAFENLQDNLRRLAAQSEDAFDALVSVIKVREQASEIASLQQSTDPTGLLEGRIWQPRGELQH